MPLQAVPRWPPHPRSLPVQAGWEHPTEQPLVSTRCGGQEVPGADVAGQDLPEGSVWGLVGQAGLRQDPVLPRDLSGRRADREAVWRAPWRPCLSSLPLLCPHLPAAAVAVSSVFLPLIFLDRQRGESRLAGRPLCGHAAEARGGVRPGVWCLHALLWPSPPLIKTQNFLLFGNLRYGHLCGRVTVAGAPSLSFPGCPPMLCICPTGRLLAPLPVLSLVLVAMRPSPPAVGPQPGALCLLRIADTEGCHATSHLAVLGDGVQAV